MYDCADQESQVMKNKRTNFRVESPRIGAGFVTLFIGITMKLVK